jgi:hypothetical protein
MVSLVSIFQFFNSAHGVILVITIIANNSNVSNVIPVVRHVTKEAIQIVLAVIQKIHWYFLTVLHNSVQQLAQMDTINVYLIIHVSHVIKTVLPALGDLVLIV